jgi:hypothetical protein
MSEKIIVAIIGGALPPIVTTLLACVTNMKLKRRLRDPNAVARAMAIGYFYSFLKPIGEELKHPAITIRFPAHEKRIVLSKNCEHVFNRNQVRMVCLLPKQLSSQTFGKVDALVPPDEAFIVITQQNQLTRPVFYDIDARKNLVIHDSVRTYRTLKHYGEGERGLVGPWEKFEEEALKEFEVVVNDLMEKHEVLTGRFSWSLIG